MGKLIRILINCTGKKLFRDGYMIKCFMIFMDASIDKSDSDLFIQCIIAMSQSKMCRCLMSVNCFGSPFQGIGGLRIVTPSIIDLIVIYVF